MGVGRRWIRSWIGDGVGYAAVCLKNDGFCNGSP
jgi:hypothetical protein